MIEYLLMQLTFRILKFVYCLVKYLTYPSIRELSLTSGKPHISPFTLKGDLDWI